MLESIELQGSVPVRHLIRRWGAGAYSGGRNAFLPLRRASEYVMIHAVFAVIMARPENAHSA